MFQSFSAELQGDEDTERILPDDFYYDFNELASQAFRSEGIPPQLLSFQYPFLDKTDYFVIPSLAIVATSVWLAALHSIETNLTAFSSDCSN